MRLIGILIAAVAFFVVSAAAQTPQQPGLLPSQIAIKMDNVINQWASTIEDQQKKIYDLEKEIAALKAKYEPLPDSRSHSSGPHPVPPEVLPPTPSQPSK